MIFYFSGTGNTKWAAQRLADATGERLVAMAQALEDNQLSYTLEDDERLGFCFPTHGWQVPAIVRLFVDRLTMGNLKPSTFCYAVTTCGDCMGQTMDMMDQALSKKGITLKSSLSLVMPESYVCLPFMYTDSPEREQQKLNRAQADLDNFIAVVKNRQAGTLRLRKGPLPWLLTHVIGQYFNRRMITDSKFRVDEERCIGCRQCQQACPVGNVAMSDSSNATPHPTWLNNGKCTCCLACYHHCPRHAIDYGRYTPRRGQYYYGHDNK